MPTLSPYSTICYQSHIVFFYGGTSSSSLSHHICVLCNGVCEAGLSKIYATIYVWVFHTVFDLIRVVLVFGMVIIF